ncbi:MAG: FAD-dependent monooxygenase, partial [Solirubrobacterales bacterium]|nr:FAD-dependent monooxygenase [Solirubrobacterales bacterium]
LGRESPLETMAAFMKRRLGANVALDDVAWAAPFRMHHRLSRRLAGERRFLLGDAGHLSSPFGGEGLNSGLHDGCNLGWKLALAARGHAGPGLLESFEHERVSADRHVLEVSGQLHALAHAAVESARTGVRPAPPPPEQVAALVRARCMLDVEYADSPLVGEYVAGGADATGLPGPGVRYPQGLELAGTRHHILLFGDAEEAAAARLRDRWGALVGVAHVTDATPSALLIRPDGYVGFRAVPADATGIEALDAHLRTYLFPTPRR